MDLNIQSITNFQRLSSAKTDIKLKSAKFIEATPNKILLIKVIDQKFYEGHLQLKNITNNYVVFRFFNNHHMLYTLSPSVYYIKPNETLYVNIKRFEVASIDELKTKDKILLIVMESEHKLIDINDAKNFIKKEDLYSPLAQQINFEIVLDNGSNSRNYYNMINERKTIVKEYNEQLNINSLTSIEEVNKHIDEVKSEIEKYNIQIEELMHNIKDISKKNIIKKSSIYFDKNLFDQKNKFNLSLPESYPPFLVVFFCCIGLFIGKFLNRFY